VQRALLKDLTRAEGAEGLVHVVAGLSGHPMQFRPLARRLSGAWRMRGVLYPIWAGGDAHCPSVEALAGDMVPALADAAEPVILFGYSFGGTVAYAIACRLAQQGRRTAVVMLDSHVAELRRRAWRKQPLLLRGLRRARKGVRRVLRTLPREALLRLRGKGPLPGGWAPRDEPLRSFHFESLAASRRYVPPRSDVPIVMIRAVKPKGPAWLRRIWWPEKDHGWGDVAPVVAVLPCPATHLTIARHDHVDRLAPRAEEAFRIALRAARGQPRPPGG